jgi:hypothetical protein
MLRLVSVFKYYNIVITRLALRALETHGSNALHDTHACTPAVTRNHSSHNRSALCLLSALMWRVSVLSCWVPRYDISCRCA